MNATLHQAGPAAGVRRTNSSGGVLRDLVDDIEQKYHDRLKRELRQTETAADQLADQQGKRLPDAIELAGEVKRLRVELEWHLWKEHADVFPLCRNNQPARSGRRLVRHITDLQRENRNACGLLRRIRTLQRGVCIDTDDLSVAFHELERLARAYLRAEEKKFFPEALRRAVPSTFFAR
jgi:iron-sulfur cluster repair protein YtfE (RIC family)